jgi:Bifunctional DNA primase/polymerase, N-terminal
MLTVADMMTTALRWHAAGYSVVPIKPDGSKQPDLTTWRDYQHTQPPEDRVSHWGQHYAGMGVLCGGPMCLEMLEVEGYALYTTPVVRQLMEDNGLGEVWAVIMGGYIERSPRGGLHWFLRVTGGPARGNTKLARRRDPDDPTKVQVLWETRGAGGQTVIAPSNGRTSPDGTWAVIRGTVEDIPVITVEERDAVYAVLAMVDETPAADPPPAEESRPRAEGDALRPGDDFNARATWDDILGSRGWTKVRAMGNGWTWRRPEKKGPGISATTGQAKDGVDRLFVFSTSTEFDSERPYSKFAAYALLEHRGDMGAAARALRAAGYGAPSAEGEDWFNSLPDADTTPPVPPEAEDALFGATPMLGHIRQAARARLISPMAVLGAVLARVVAELHPRVVLPPIIGTRASLNLFVGLVGPSGAAKTAAAGVAEDSLTILNSRARVQGTGSGEGLIASFLRKDPDAAEAHTDPYIIRDDPHVCVLIDEIGMLGSIQSRTGSTLAPVLRSGWSGAALETINADPSRKRVVPKMQYRLTVIAGIQPLAADVLFNDADTGTPQRWVWLPALDRRMPDVEPEWPGPLKWQAPPLLSNHGGWTVIAVPDHIRDTLRAAHRARHRGTDHNHLDGHLALTRLKVAAALAALHGSYEITDLWWALAGLIMDISTEVRTQCQRALAAEDDAKAESQGRREHVKETGKALAVAEATERDARALWRKVSQHADGTGGGGRSHPVDAGCTTRCITMALSRRARGQREQALEYAVDRDWVRVESDRYHPGSSQPAGVAG